LKGEDISLAARIFSVADSFDAMTSSRPYRSPMTVERALAEIRAGTDTQFDPDIVRVFVDMIERDQPADDPAFSRALAHAG
jgi:HD-GYP domain-containing protein (c-di-GMP phosphodiesterase class II)